MKNFLLRLFLLSAFLSSCKSNGYFPQAIDGEQLQITKDTEEDEQIKDYLTPFR